jgi:hypothetical protein
VNHNPSMKVGLEACTSTTGSLSLECSVSEYSKDVYLLLLVDVRFSVILLIFCKKILSSSSIKC